ncbi:hypothetical protein GTU79_18300 [Sodalis ligni]|uniref:hypothetical protein n=1 Tax=Sodalis ligni TaxID=2697027 RepID=UPI001BDE9BA0|nr:hypothetical protein [Sodalis ligni]QWA09340.1 hypothetical protein GTU79_18300 [Sodalis ligni]
MPKFRFFSAFKRSPGFSNALVQSIGGGNTIFINRAAREIAVRAGLVDVVSHDWWLYILISGVGVLFLRSTTNFILSAAPRKSHWNKLWISSKTKQIDANI